MGKKPKLLFIDDELENENSLERFLGKEFQVTPCTNVADAKIELSKNDYSVAIIDMALPEHRDSGKSLEEEGGLEICRYIRDNFLKTRGIVLTGYASLQNYRKAMEFGVVYDYLSKSEVRSKDVLEVALRASQDSYNLLIYFDDNTYNLFEYLGRDGKSKIEIIAKSLELYHWAQKRKDKGYEIIAKKGNYIIPFEDKET